ncbi:MAG TPA: hypothetical protein VET65_14820 [Candidatus Limnocylindrales bacterium]|nr:hypothetical protein [Candidatus Limnocylindrales bacterium]
MPRSRWSRALLIVSLLAASLYAGAANASADAATGSVGSGSSGFDISYPQCGGVYPTGAFGIVGVNGGYPFKHYNPCLKDEYAHATHAALYLNTGYDPAYTAVDDTHTTPACQALSATIEGTRGGDVPAERQAWAVGCSEAARSVDYASSQGITNLSAWWLDVETANSWSDNQVLNQFAIQGVIDMLETDVTVSVGIYSTAYQWHQIVGTLPVYGVAAEWVATGDAAGTRVARVCGAPGFTGAPVTLVQYTSDFDHDVTC